ncbi:MAG TPA: ABC transporter substrate-binding protein [Burkholderiales bacterium]|jgi:branched-chain amino acid transport system substrate-binding protein|nr:ABC transporter substrate-binding protein [Burkholderiales bacterium]
MKRRLATLAAAALVSFSAGAANELKIGFLSTLSGPAGGIGIEIRDGFNLALKLAGNKLGNLPTEVIFADDTLNPDTGRQLAERLLKRDRVNLMTGVVFSNVMLAAWPTIQEAKVFYIAPNATPTSITGKGCSPYFYSASWPNEAHHEAAGEFANSRGFKNIYLIAPNYPAGKDSLTGFKRMYKGNVVAEVYSKLNQLDYSAELAQIRAAKPDALYAFLPGGMGINFIKQFVAAGLSKDIQLVVPGFVSDQDVVRAVGDPMLGLFDTSHWAYDLDNDANRKFVAEFEKEYKRIPSLFAEQGYTAALIIDQAVRDAKGKVEDEKAFHAALMKAPERANTPRGHFKEAANGTPIQDYYVRALVKDRDGRIVNRKVNTILRQHRDYWAKDCSMK